MPRPCPTSISAGGWATAAMIALTLSNVAVFSPSKIQGGIHFAVAFSFDGGSGARGSLPPLSPPTPTTAWPLRSARSLSRRSTASANNMKNRMTSLSSLNREDDGNSLSFIAPDYLITDSLNVAPSERTSLAKSMSNPRDILASLLLTIGLAVSGCNVLGEYGEVYNDLTLLSVALGGISCAVSLLPLAFPRWGPAHALGGGKDGGISISSNVRLGVVDDAVVHAYAALYSGAMSWLALRLSPAYPRILIWDAAAAAAPWAAVGIVTFSLLAPVVTLWENYDRGRHEVGDDGDGNGGITTLFSDVGTREGGLSELIVRLVRRDSSSAVIKIQQENGGDRGNDSTDTDGGTNALPPILLPPMTETELFRAYGLLAIGFLGILFLPGCLSLGLRGQDWWTRVLEAYPAQGRLETSTTLFALYATEASMVSHRAAKNGVAPLREIVPLFALVCLLLAVVPCICAFYWLHGDVSFYEFYFL